METTVWVTLCASRSEAVLIAQDLSRGGASFSPKMPSKHGSRAPGPNPELRHQDTWLGSRYLQHTDGENMAALP